MTHLLAAKGAKTELMLGYARVGHLENSLQLDHRPLLALAALALHLDHPATEAALCSNHNNASWSCVRFAHEKATVP